MSAVSTNGSPDVKTTKFYSKCPFLCCMLFYFPLTVCRVIKNICFYNLFEHNQKHRKCQWLGKAVNCGSRANYPWMRSKCLQRSLASVSAVSNSSWHVEAEASAGRWSFMGGEKMKMTMPHLKRIVEDAVPFLIWAQCLFWVIWGQISFLL